MKVIHISCVAPPETGGIGQSAFEMVKRLNARGVEATLVARTLRGPRTEPDAPFVKRLDALLRWGNAGVLSGLKPLMKKADVVHLHYPFFGTAEAVAQECLMMRKPLVITFHMDATAQFPVGTLFDVYRVIAQPAILRAARRVFVSSIDYAMQSSMGGYLRAHPERVMELPFGVDHAHFSPVDEATRLEVRRSFGIPDGKRVIGFVGGMDAAHAFKGIPVLLKAMSLLPADCHALLVGDGAQRRIFEAKAREFGVADRCHFTGRVASERLPNAYRAMDVFAFPSTTAAEAFGLVAVEAMACGVPVVASNLPGVRSVVRDRTTGLLVPRSNAIALTGALKELLENESFRSTMGHAAREQAMTRFDWNRHVETLMAVYREVEPMRV